MKSGFQGLGFGVWGLGSGVWGLGVGVEGLWLRVWGVGFRAPINEPGAVLFHTMHLLNGFRKSTPPQNRQLIVLIENS